MLNDFRSAEDQPDGAGKPVFPGFIGYAEKLCWDFLVGAVRNRAQA